MRFENELTCKHCDTKFLDDLQHINFGVKLCSSLGEKFVIERGFACLKAAKTAATLLFPVFCSFILPFTCAQHVFH